MVSTPANPEDAATEGGATERERAASLRELSAALVAANHEVVIYTRQPDPSITSVQRRELDSGVILELLPGLPTTEAEMLGVLGVAGGLLADAWQRERPDVIHSHSWTSGLAALSGVQRLREVAVPSPDQSTITRGPAVPVIHTFHSPSPMLRRAQVLGTADRTLLETRMKLETALLRSVELTVAATEHDLDELTRLGVPRDRVLVVPSGIDIDRFAPHGPVAERGETPRLVAYGEMVPSSGFETVIAALRGVPDAELIIIGGPLAGNPEAARLQAGARQVGVADRVTMLDSVEYTELPSWLRSADAVVHVPWDASVGALAALMGMACGVPVVISSIEEVSDAVVDGVTGVHLAPRRPDQLAVALRSLLNDPVRRLGFGVAGADRVRSRFSWPRVAADYERAYQRLLPIVTLEEEMAGVVDEEIDEAYQASSGSETV